MIILGLDTDITEAEAKKHKFWDINGKFMETISKFLAFLKLSKVFVTEAKLKSSTQNSFSFFLFPDQVLGQRLPDREVLQERRTGLRRRPRARREFDRRFHERPEGTTTTSSTREGLVSSTC